MNKKLKLLLFVFFVVIYLLAFKSVSADNIGVDSSFDGFVTEEEVFAAMKYSFSNAVNTISLNCLVEYSGMYIDDNNILVLMFAGETKTLDSKMKFNNDKRTVLKSADGKKKQIIRVVSAKYSYAKLEEVTEILIRKISIDCGVIDMSIDVKNNRIEIGIESNADKEMLTDYFCSLLPAEVNNDIIEVIRLLNSEKYEPSTSITQTSGVYNQKNFFASVGVGCKLSGTKGFLTCGHGFNNNEIIVSHKKKRKKRFFIT